jgi:hypothetical protein
MHSHYGTWAHVVTFYCTLVVMVLIFPIISSSLYVTDITEHNFLFWFFSVVLSKLCYLLHL